MEISAIIVRRFSNAAKLKAVVSVTFDDCFVIHDVKVIEGNSGLFVAMPSRKTPNGNFIDIIHPINKEFREYLSREIIDKYLEELAVHLTEDSLTFETQDGRLEGQTDAGESSQSF